MDDLTVTGNLIEAVLWFAFAAAFAVLAYQASGPKRRLWLIQTVAFLVFSASDVIESQTGAWWRPWWLLIMKASCIAVFLHGVREYLRIPRSAGTVESTPPSGGSPAGPQAGSGQSS